MGDLFKALTSGLARFVYAWLMPSIITTGVFVLTILPARLRVELTSLGGIATFIVVVLGLSIVFAYASRPLYQFLEGYTMPRWFSRPLVRRNQRRYIRLTYAELHGTPRVRHEATEKLKAYPEGVDLIMPTRLGNALKALESYGTSRFGLDSQTFWYELQAVADERVRQATEETRAAVDFFLSSIGHLTILLLLAVVSISTGHSQLPASLVVLACIGLLPCAYMQAVRNVTEWRYAVQAMVNTTRPALAAALAMRLPPTFEAEQTMWQAWSDLVHYGGYDHGRLLDDHRLK